MKVLLVLHVGGETREIPLHCGNGEKSFKWVGLVATQKFALAAPMGTVRCRESVRGCSEHAQHHPVSIRLENGDTPMPSAMLSEYLRDGDSVHIDMESDRNVNSVGYAKTSSWFDEAFKNSDYDDGSHDVSSRKSHGVADVDPFGDSAACKVMRNLVRTQIIDDDKVAIRLMDEWPLVKLALPRLSDEDNVKLKHMCRRYYCFLLELFNHYIPLQSTMDLSTFTSFMTDSNIFGEASAARADVVYRRLATARSIADLDFPAFVASLIICSQQLHVNTLDRDAYVRDSAEALYAVVQDMLLPLIYRLNLNHVTKDIFTGPAFLDNLRSHHDDLVMVFEKTASRSGTEPPVMLHIEHMADLLIELNLLKNGETVGRIEALNSYLLAARSGLVKGEPYARIPSITTDSVDKQRTQNLRRGEDYDFPENIITYPEFVEVCARAGAARYAKGLLDSDLSVSEKRSAYTEAMDRGVCVVAELNRKRPPTPTKQYSRVGR